MKRLISFSLVGIVCMLFTGCSLNLPVQFINYTYTPVEILVKAKNMDGTPHALRSNRKYVKYYGTEDKHAPIDSAAVRQLDSSTLAIVLPAKTWVNLNNLTGFNGHTPEFYDVFVKQDDATIPVTNKFKYKNRGLLGNYFYFYYNG